MDHDHAHLHSHSHGDSHEDPELWNRLHGSGHAELRWSDGAASPELVEFLDAFPPATGDRALDVGCGSGADLVLLAERGYEVIGVDVSTTGLELARERVERSGASATFIDGDITAGPLPGIDDASIDLVLDRNVVHHFHGDALDAYAAELARMLKPGGLAFIRSISERHRDDHVLREDDVERLFNSETFELRRVEHADMHMSAERGTAPGLFVEAVRRS